MSSLFSIGHGSRQQELFLSLLKSYDIRYLIDVRSIPQSRFHPQFNKQRLQESLAANGVTYVFMGDELGGRPKDASCYDDDGKINYRKVATKNWFKSGLERLLKASQLDERSAIMCSERNPADCHRTLLIGQELLKRGLSLSHIDEQGQLRTQEEVIASLKKKGGSAGLFDLP